MTKVMERDEVVRVIQITHVGMKAERGIIKHAVECGDIHGNTLLSEAAAGGSSSTVKLLLERRGFLGSVMVRGSAALRSLCRRGANPNSQGEFARSPLWRASFLGKADVIAPLLEAGADPRVGNEQGELPLHVASAQGIKDAIAAWDVGVTDSLVAKWQARQEERRAAEAAQLAAEVGAWEGGDLPAGFQSGGEFLLESLIHHSTTAAPLTSTQGPRGRGRGRFCKG